MLSSFGRTLNSLVAPTSLPQFSLRSLAAACILATGLVTSLASSPAHADDFADVSKFIRAGQFNEAMSKVDAVLAQRPRDAQMRFLKGLILTEQNKNAEAITVFTKLTEDYPELPEPHNNLAVLYASSGQYDKARGALEAAIRTNPTYATAHENLGDVYAKLASQAYDKALQLDSGNNSAKSKLTMVRTLVGNTTSAALPKPSTAAAAPSKTPTAAVAAAKPTPSPTPTLVAATIVPSPAAPIAATPVPTAAASKPTTLVAKAEASKPEVKVETKVEAKPEVKIDPKAEAKAKAAADAKALAEAKAAEKAEKAAEAKAQEAKANAERDDVLKAVNAWAKAWSAKDTKAYLNAYGNDFQTPKGEPRKAWADERRSRIESKGRISVQIEEAQVKLEGATATVKFRQIYTSDKLTANSRKILVLAKQGGKWQIKQERSAS
jgi:Flp pilus assembly protein TadD